MEKEEKSLKKFVFSYSLKLADTQKLVDWLTAGIPIFALFRIFFFFFIWKKEKKICIGKCQKIQLFDVRSTQKLVKIHNI